MRALLIDGPGAIHLRDVPEPAWPPDEVRISVRLAGICNTDLELLKGYMGFTGIPGHEFVGVVTEGPERLKGRRVVGEINVACGNCEMCRAGLGRHCATRTVLGIYNRPGAFAERLSLPQESLLSVPDEVNDEEAVFTEPVAAALEILEQVHIPPGEKILVLGDGKLGLLVVQVLLLHGCRVHVQGRHEKKLSLARRWGATTSAVTPDEPENPSRDRYLFVVEATGSARGFRDALASVRPRGTLILKSTYAPNQLPPLDAAKVVVDEITLVGSRCGRFGPALRLLAQGKLDVRSLIDHRKPFDQAEEAFRLAEQRGVLKVLLQLP
jgi:threonine dehydrogenase-like Zn-dependent dehydrogenase